jgi:hypothetical protein
LSRFVILLREHDADPPFSTPNYITMLPHLAGHYVQRDLVRNAYGTHKIESGASRREVANSAFDAGVIELNRSSLENPLSWCCAPLFHCAGLSQNFKRQANRAAKAGTERIPFANQFRPGKLAGFRG